MIPVKEFTNGADVLAHAKAIRAKFYCPRQIALAQVKAASEKAASDAAVTQDDPNRFRVPTIGTASKIAAGIVNRVALSRGFDPEEIAGRGQTTALAAAKAEAAIAIKQALPHWGAERIGTYVGRSQSRVADILNKAGLGRCDD